MYKNGITIVVRPTNKPLDILVYKDRAKWSAWELTNYSKSSFLRWNKLQHYINNLNSAKELGFENKFLVVNYPENLRKAVDERRSEEWNIEQAELELAKNGIFLVYWEEQDIPNLKEEIIESWTDEE